MSQALFSALNAIGGICCIFYGVASGAASRTRQLLQPDLPRHQSLHGPDLGSHVAPVARYWAGQFERAGDHSDSASRHRLWLGPSVLRCCAEPCTGHRLVGHLGFGMVLKVFFFALIIMIILSWVAPGARHPGAELFGKSPSPSWHPCVESCLN